MLPEGYKKGLHNPKEGMTMAARNCNSAPSSLLGKACTAIRQWKLYCPSLTILTPLPGTDLFRRLREKLTTQNLELFDLVHAVPPTQLSLAET